MKLGEAIKLKRRKEGLSQQKLAALIDVCESSIGKYEHLGRTPQDDNWIAIRNWLGVSEDEMLELCREQKYRRHGVDIVARDEIKELKERVRRLEEKIGV